MQESLQLGRVERASMQEGLQEAKAERLWLREHIELLEGNLERLVSESGRHVSSFEGQAAKESHVAQAGSIADGPVGLPPTAHGPCAELVEQTRRLKEQLMGFADVA